MFHLADFSDKLELNNMLIHSFESFERVGKWENGRYNKVGVKPYSTQLCGVPRCVNLYAVANMDVNCDYEI